MENYIDIDRMVELRAEELENTMVILRREIDSLKDDFEHCHPGRREEIRQEHDSRVEALLLVREAWLMYSRAN